MWEYRIVWPGTRPAWWDEAWQRGEVAVKGRGDKVEERPDTYLVISGRTDAGLKLRDDKDVEIKTLLFREGHWELWEKCPFKKWNSLEVVRFANMLRAGKFRADTAQSSPLKGVEEFLSRLNLSITRVRVEKRRIQATAAELLAGTPASNADPSWMAEFVEMTLPNKKTLVSLCLETMMPQRPEIDSLITDGAVVCGYPELLARHLNGTL